MIMPLYSDALCHLDDEKFLEEKGDKIAVNVSTHRSFLFLLKGKKVNVCNAGSIHYYFSMFSLLLASLSQSSYK